MEIKRFIISVILITTSQLSFSGIFDRSGQPVDILFADGQVLQYEQRNVTPDVEGEDSLSRSTGRVSQPFKMQQLNFKTPINQQFSAAIILDQPWGGDFVYDETSLLYGGTSAKLNSRSLTSLLQGQLTEHFSVFGGLRLQEISGELTLDGLAYGPLAGYHLSIKNNVDQGYTLGASYGIKEYALRLTLAYHSKITHKLDLDESLSPASTQSDFLTPRSINVDFRSGIAPKTLAFSKIRWVEWSEFRFKPQTLGQEVVNLNDNLITYTLGLARQLSPKWLGSLAINHEPKLPKSNSLFQPTNGYTGLAINGIYYANKHWQLRGLYAKTWVGDASAETAGGNSVKFSDNSSDTVGLSVQYSY